MFTCTKTESPVAEVDVSLHGPGGEIQLYRVGVGVGRVAWIEDMGCFGVVPPLIAAEAFGEAGVLDRVALQTLADEGKRPRGAAKAQGHQGLGPLLRRAMAELELGVEVVAEIDAAAVVQQGLEAL